MKTYSKTEIMFKINPEGELSLQCNGDNLETGVLPSQEEQGSYRRSIGDFY